MASNPKLPSHLASEMSMDYDDEVALQARNHSNFVKPGFWKMLQRSFLG